MKERMADMGRIGGHLGRIGFLPASITVLPLADGVLHLALDYVLFGGRLVGGAWRGAPAWRDPARGRSRAAAWHRRGARANPFVLPMNELFLLNCIGYVALLLAFWLGLRLLGSRRWVVNVVLIVNTAASIVAWLDMGEPNPHGLGHASKSIEIPLIAALMVHLWTLLRPALMRAPRLYAAAS
jgi:hypothetical protein